MYYVKIVLVVILFLLVKGFWFWILFLLEGMFAPLMS